MWIYETEKVSCKGQLQFRYLTYTLRPDLCIRRDNMSIREVEEQRKFLSYSRQILVCGQTVSMWSPDAQWFIMCDLLYLHFPPFLCVKNWLRTCPTFSCNKFPILYLRYCRPHFFFLWSTDSVSQSSPTACISTRTAAWFEDISMY